ncbi:MICAL-like protein 1 isoform X3 [Penaeus japonicus]|uniref:MICAL-like protein 1 isoform X3 n=1 Tax=Penaeus japonicus TaxID=27405 RepID=UPI001C7139BD|nr:MICAL-like protein 1 isoform X3 [Penaeus japonicus]
MSSMIAKTREDTSGSGLEHPRSSGEATWPSAESAALGPQVDAPDHDKRASSPLRDATRRNNCQELESAEEIPFIDDDDGGGNGGRSDKKQGKEGTRDGSSEAVEVTLRHSARTTTSRHKRRAEFILSAPPSPSSPLLAPFSFAPSTSKSAAASTRACTSPPEVCNPPNATSTFPATATASAASATSASSTNSSSSSSSSIAGRLVSASAKAQAKELVIFRRKRGRRSKDGSNTNRCGWLAEDAAIDEETKGVPAAPAEEEANFSGEETTTSAASTTCTTSTTNSGGTISIASTTGTSTTSTESTISTASAASNGAVPYAEEDDIILSLLRKILTETTEAETEDIMEHRGTKALEIWARRATDGYQGVSITNMSTAWRNGLAFCALIHRFRPDLIDFASLKPENILENNALAFRVAEQHLGIPALLDAEDMVENDVPDRLSVLTYVSQFYQAFHSMGLTSPKRIVNTTTTAQSPLPGVNKSKLTPTPQPKTKTEIKTDKVLTGGRGRREVCVGCNNPVYLAERLLVGSPGQLMHRTCFRCARCSTQLTLASYYETEKSQFCCETCPDEERTVMPDVVDSTSIASSASTKLARQSSASDSESDSDSEDSDEESDSYSNDADSMLEDVSHISSTQTEAPSRLPKPRTVFLSKTLEDEDSENKPEEPKEDNTHLSRASNFSQVSPALFGSKVKDSGVEGKRDSRPDHCDNAKVLKTDPPERLTLDTGQGDRVSSISNGRGKGSSSIVAERLKLFREIGDKTTNADRAKSSTVLSLKDISEKKENVQIKEKESIPKQEEMLEVDEREKDRDTKELSNGKDVQVDKFISDYLEKDEIEDMEVDSKTNSEKTKEDDTPSVVIPAIIMPTESTENISQEEDATQEEPTNEAVEERSPKLSHSTNAQVKEFNPFEDEDESQQNESGVIVNQSHSSPATDKNNATSASHDSGADVSSASAQSVQYPTDLNPFGSDEEEEEVKDPEPAQVEESEKQNKKLIKVNLNPFGSDEEDLSEDESKTVEEKDKSLKNLNPFWSDDEDEKDEVSSSSSTPSKNKAKPPRPPPPTLARNSTPSQMYGSLSAKSSPSSVGGTTPGKKIIAPPPPSMRELFPQQQDVPSYAPPKPPRSPALSKMHPHPSPSSPTSSVTLKRKDRRAPAPPQTATPRSGRTSPTDTINSDSLSVSSFGVQSQTTQGQEDQDEVLSWKMQKDLKNHSNKMNGTADQLAPPKPARAPQVAKNLGGVAGLARNPSMSKSEAGEWQRKKGPAPPRPVPQKRALKKMPMRLVQQELQDIEIKQTELERQGVLLETAIRKKTESTSNNPQEEVANTPNSGPNSIEVEDMILQLFELVNEKNELFRRQTELMYLKREKRLEEEYVELEYQIRCLMLKTPAEKTDQDTAQEEDLIARLVKVVEQRDEIINCLELDRLREAQEDESIATHMMQYQGRHFKGCYL